MASHGLTFGVFVPQGWKMELASISDPQAKWAKSLEIAHLAGPYLTAPGSCVEVVDGTGHFLHLERPDVVNELIIGFLT